MPMSDIVQAVPGQNIGGDVGGPDLLGITVSDASGTTRVILGDISGGQGLDYGLKVVGADGSTVIIDGSSDMFKISATGTIALLLSGVGDTGDTPVTLAGLGPQSIVLAFLGFIQITEAGSARMLSTYQTIAATVMFGATASGGAVTTSFIPDVRSYGIVQGYLDGSFQQVIDLYGFQILSSGNIHFTARYYVLSEVAI